VFLRGADAPLGGLLPFNYGASKRGRITKIPLSPPFSKGETYKGRLRGVKPLFFLFPLSASGEGDKGGEVKNILFERGDKRGRAKVIK
jgi:hypothetical protein